MSLKLVILSIPMKISRQQAPKTVGVPSRSSESLTTKKSRQGAMAQTSILNAETLSD
jgi:hypothetical protein